MILTGVDKKTELSVLPRVNPNTLKKLEGLSICIMQTEGDDMLGIELTKNSAYSLMMKCASLLGFEGVVYKPEELQRKR